MKRVSTVSYHATANGAGRITRSVPDATMPGQSTLPILQNEKNTPWYFEGTSDRNDYPSITNQKGTQIFIAPRRYVIQLQKQPGKDSIHKIQLEEITNILRKVHNYQYAPEPLRSVVSTFQLLGATSGHSIFVSLTNISSQKIRKDLLNGILGVLETNYVPLKTWITMGWENGLQTSYETTTLDEVIRIITQSQQNITDAKRDYSPPWKRQVYIQLSHRAPLTEHPAVPQRGENLARPGPSKEEGRKRKGAIIAQQEKKKKSTDRNIIEELLALDEEDLLNIVTPRIPTPPHQENTSKLKHTICT
uniref:Uncharacterized protein n=1 Tax=Parvoviridae sp. TaxID=1940570 RepID=A0A7D3V1I0_9VIRU|nr:MAG: hypothetical protein [Parvoviridae sp.]